MSELSQEARALINGVSALENPASADKERIKQRLALQLGAAAFATAAVNHAVHAGTSSAPAAVAAGKAGLVGLAGKVALCAGLLGALGASVLLGGRREATVPAAVPAPWPAAVQPRVVAAPVEAVPVAATPVVATALPSAPSQRVRHKLARPVERAKPAEPAVKAASTLSEELRVLSAAQAALRAGDAQQALSLSHQHERQFPSGVLREERLGVEALAECSLGQKEGAHARAFLAASPSSPLAARVRKACGIP